MYIDGFNLYFGVLRDNPGWKWLNLQKFCEKLRPDDDVVAIKYFTAIVDPEKQHSQTKDRQKTYIRALTRCPKVEVIYGKYQMREVTCRARCKERHKVPEEKKTDVEIAVSMLSDSIAGLTDRVVLVSGDSDQEPAIQWIINRSKGMPQKIKVSVYIPELPGVPNPRRNDSYKNMGVEVRTLPIEEIKTCQFPALIDIGNGRSIKRPGEWT